jgi:hypothetical protein
MEQNRRPRNNHIATTTSSLTKEPKAHNGEKTASSINGVWKTVSLHAKD